MTTPTKRAFTLIELIVVMAIIVTLSVIGFISYNDYVRDSRNTTRIAEMNDIIKAIDQFIFTYGAPPKCNANAIAAANDYCYFTSHSSFTGSKAKGTTGGWNPGTSSYGPDSEGILPADWTNLKLKNTPMDPRNVYFLYAYNGPKYAILATKELPNGYAAIVKGSQTMDRLSTESASTNLAATNVVSSAAGLGVRLDGETAQAGVISVANPLAIKFNDVTSTTADAAPTTNWTAGIPSSL